MSYAIIRNEKYTADKMAAIYRHNERKNTNYSNKDIDFNRSKYNYSIKQCYMPYLKAFNQLKERYNLKGQIKKTSKIACEYIITSDKDFFEEIGPKESRRYFETAYKFVSEFRNLGEEYIISAKVHMDETTPHMHLTFVPVVHVKDPKTDEEIHKVSCSEFWRGKNSYKELQDKFYEYMIKAGFVLERGNGRNEHIPIETLKKITNYEAQKLESQKYEEEKEIETNDIDTLKKEYKRLILKSNSISRQYTRVKVINDSNIKRMEHMQKEYNELNEKYKKEKQSNNWLKYCLKKTIECSAVLLDLSIERMRGIVNSFIKECRKNERRNNE